MRGYPTPYPTETRYCAHCGAEIIRRADEDRTRFYQRKTCNRSCSAQLTRAAKIKPRFELVCDQCGKSFMVHKSDLVSPAGYRKRFCSHECHSTNRRGRAITPADPSNKEEVRCLVCGNSFTAWVCQHKKYCGQQCAALDRIKQRDSAKPSTIETATAIALQQIGIEFRQQEIIHPYLVDFYVPSKNCIIECLGDYHHCNPRRYSPERDTPLQAMHRERDQIRFTTLRDRGFHLVTLWEYDIRQAITQNRLGDILREAIS